MISAAMDESDDGHDDSSGKAEAWGPPVQAPHGAAKAIAGIRLLVDSNEVAHCLSLPERKEPTEQTFAEIGRRCKCSFGDSLRQRRRIGDGAEVRSSHPFVDGPR